MPVCVCVCVPVYLGVLFCLSVWQVRKEKDDVKKREAVRRDELQRLQALIKERQGKGREGGGERE